MTTLSTPISTPSQALVDANPSKFQVANVWAIMRQFLGEKHCHPRYEARHNEALHLQEIRSSW